MTVALLIPNCTFLCDDFRPTGHSSASTQNSAFEAHKPVCLKCSALISQARLPNSEKSLWTTYAAVSQCKGHNIKILTKVAPCTPQLSRSFWARNRRSSKTCWVKPEEADIAKTDVPYRSLILDYRQEAIRRVNNPCHMIITTVQSIKKAG